MNKVSIARWRPWETAPKDGSAFLVTMAGPTMDICFWDARAREFRDYFHKQKIAQKWPYMVGWMPLPKPAAPGNSRAECRKANGWPAKARRRS